MSFEEQLQEIVWGFSTKWVKLEAFTHLEDDILNQISDIFYEAKENEGVYFWNTIIGAPENYGLCRFIIEKGDINALKLIPMIHGIDLSPETDNFFSILSKGFQSQEALMINQTEMWPYWNTFSCVKTKFLHERITSRSNQFVSSSEAEGFKWDMYQVVWFSSDTISWNPTYLLVKKRILYLNLLHLYILMISCEL